MPGYELSKPAEQDLENIFRYTLETWGEDQFRAYRALLVRTIEELVISPAKIGSKEREDLCQGCRAFHIGRHWIFYRMQERKLQVIRVLHDRMEFKRHIRAQ